MSPRKQGDSDQGCLETFGDQLCFMVFDLAIDLGFAPPEFAGHDCRDGLLVFPTMVKGEPTQPGSTQSEIGNRDGRFASARMDHLGQGGPVVTQLYVEVGTAGGDRIYLMGVAPVPPIAGSGTFIEARRNRASPTRSGQEKVLRW